MANDRNYMMAIYKGKDQKGKEKSEFELVNMLEAARYFKTSNDKEAADYNIVPVKSTSGYPLAYTLKIGTMVLLYENNPSEIWEGTKAEISRRLYKVTGLSKSTVKPYVYGMITMLYHEEARPQKELKPKKGEYVQNEAFRPIIIMSHRQINVLVQGYDFEINEVGEIKRLR